MNTKGIEIFRQEFFDAVRKLPMAPGKIIPIYRIDMPNPASICNMKVYVDTGVQLALQQQGYQYLPTKSTPDVIYLLDIRHGYRDYENCVDEIAYTYDADNDCVTEIVVACKNIQIDNGRKSEIQ